MLSRAASGMDEMFVEPYAEDESLVAEIRKGRPTMVTIAMVTIAAFPCAESVLCRIYHCLFIPFPLGITSVGHGYTLYVARRADIFE